jgi:hypothetical protein
MTIKNLILTSIANKESLDIYKKTIHPPINTNSLKKFVLPTAIINLKSISIWGLTETKENKRVWNSINKSDIILFLKDNKFFLKGKVIHKKIDAEIFSKILKKDQARNLLLFISEIKPIDIDFEKTIPIFANPIIKNTYGFPIKILDKNNIKILEKVFGSLENCIDYLDLKENHKVNLSDIIDEINLKTSVDFSTKKTISKRRKGQDKFRKEVLKNFKNICAVCKISEPDLLQAGHIIQIADEKKAGKIQNGICFCMTCHKLFDEGYFSFDEKYQIIFSKNKEIDPILKKNIKQKRKMGKCLVAPSSTYLMIHRIKYNIF